MLIVTSTAFTDGGAIPKRYTCEGQDAAPPLTWAGAPWSSCRPCRTGARWRDSSPGGARPIPRDPARRFVDFARAAAGKRARTPVTSARRRILEKEVGHGGHAHHRR